MRQIVVIVSLAAALCPARAFGQTPPLRTNLDALMEKALQRREIDRKNLGDYVLDEIESLSILGPGGAPIYRFNRDFTWYVRDGMHVRSPLESDGVPISEADRRKYEEQWMERERSRRKERQERIEKRAAEGTSTLGVPPINEPRFVSESYFMDFKFEPGNYFLAGHETLDGHDVLKIDYYPTHLFTDGRDPAARGNVSKDDREIDRKMNKTAQVTIWVDPSIDQIVKYTFDNVWLDFLPAAWLVRIDDLRASMEMRQPFPAAPNVWLPRGIRIHAGLTLANGSYEAEYTRSFSNYRRADVSTRITVPKDAR